MLCVYALLGLHPLGNGVGVGVLTQTLPSKWLRIAALNLGYLPRQQPLLVW